jgi:hypothetical protein
VRQRQPAGPDEWLRRDYGDLAATVESSSTQCTLSLAEIYEGVDFD